MITNEQAKQCKYIANYYGYDSQSRQTMEEAAELIQAINKFWRVKGKPWEYGNLIGEMADVQIMLTQMLQLLNVDPETWEETIDYKLERQMYRIENEQ